MRVAQQLANLFECENIRASSVESSLLTAMENADFSIQQEASDVPNED
jgi:hypothetical protein